MAIREHWSASSCMVAAISGNMPVNSVDWEGCSFLHEAARSNRHDIVVTLLRLGCNPIQTQNARGRTPMHYAAMHCNVATIEVLRLTGIGGGCSEKDYYGFTSLHFLAFNAGTYTNAALASLAEIVQCTDVDFAAKNDDGQTAAELAREKGNQTFADVIDSVRVCDACCLSCRVLISCAVRCGYTGAAMVDPSQRMVEWDNGSRSTCCNRNGPATIIKASSRGVSLIR